VSDQGGVPDVVRPELELEAVGCDLTLRRRHHTRVVDEQVDGRALVDQPGAEGGDRGERGQVQVAQGDVGVGHIGADRRDGGLPLGAVADRHDDLGAGRREAARNTEPDAVGGAGDDGAPPGEAGDREGGVPSGHELSSSREWVRPTLLAGADPIQSRPIL
jgi:hypothetical protein